MAEGVDLDGPGDLLQPFSELRGHDFPGELSITRRLFDWLAQAEENPRLNEVGRLALCVGALTWAVRDLERELVALRAANRG